MLTSAANGSHDEYRHSLMLIIQPASPNSSYIYIEYRHWLQRFIETKAYNYYEMFDGGITLIHLVHILNFNF